MSDVIEYIEGTVPCPDPKVDLVGAKNWHWNNGFAKILIDNCMEDEEKLNTQGCQTAHEMWENLCLQFKSQDCLMYTDLLQTIFELRATEGSNIVEHLAKLKKLWDQLGWMMFSEGSVLENNVLFKQVIVQSLPHSWNSFTNQFV